MFPVPVTSSSPCRQDQLLWLPHSVCSQFVGLNPSTLIMETGQDFPQLHGAAGCPSTAGPVGVCSEGLLWNTSSSTAFRTGNNHAGALGCGTDTTGALGLNGHSPVVTTTTANGTECLQNNRGGSHFAMSPTAPNPL